MRFAGCSPYPTQDVIYMTLMALRETTEDLTEFTPGRCRYDGSLWDSIPPNASSPGLMLVPMARLLLGFELTAVRSQVAALVQLKM